MKKLLISIFIISTILTPLFFINKIQNTEAATPTIKLDFVSSTPKSGTDTNSLWSWNFEIKTTDVPDNTPVWVYVYEGKIGDKKIIYSGTNTKIISGQAAAYTDYVLKSGVFYSVIVQIPIEPTIGSTYEGTVTTSNVGKINDNIVPSEDPFYIDPQDTNTNSNTYTLLAPIGGFKTTPTNIGDYFNIIFKIAIGLCGALAVVMIVIGGIQYMGDESIFAKTEAKSKITAAILGLLIALGAFALLNTIDPNLLGKKGVSIKQVSVEIVDLPDAGDGTIDPDFKKSKGSYSTDASTSPGVTNVVAKLKQGWQINQFRVYTNNRMLISIKNGTQIDNSNVIDIKPGEKGYAESGTAKVGDKKTPLGSWKILNIKTAPEGQPIYNKSGANMGASFWLLSPMSNGERGIGMHGNKNGTLDETYGCIRLKNADLLALLPYVKAGIIVDIGN